MSKVELMKTSPVFAFALLATVSSAEEVADQNAKRIVTHGRVLGMTLFDDFSKVSSRLKWGSFTACPIMEKFTVATIGNGRSGFVSHLVIRRLAKMAPGPRTK